MITTVRQSEPLALYSLGGLEFDSEHDLGHFFDKKIITPYNFTFEMFLTILEFDLSNSWTIQVECHNRRLI